MMENPPNYISYEMYMMTLLESYCMIRIDSSLDPRKENVY